MSALNLTPETEAEGRTYRFLGMQSKNRREWNLLHLANMHNNATSVALYDTLGPDAARYIMEQTGLTTMACSNDLVKMVCKLKQEDPEGKCTNLVNIVSFGGPVEQEAKDIAGEVGIKLITYEEVLAAGKANTDWKQADVNEEDFCTFSYTSGTTGDPKGVKLSHKMLVNMISSVNTRLENVN